jgi:hypothetical protein
MKAAHNNRNGNGKAGGQYLPYRIKAFFSYLHFTLLLLKALVNRPWMLPKNVHTALY